MPRSAFTLFPSGEPYLSRRQWFTITALSVLGVAPFLLWPRLLQQLFATDFLPHAYCYLRSPGLIWTHVAADTLIGVAYLVISITLAYLVHKARRDIPFHWVLMAFGLFIAACGGTHFLDSHRLDPDVRLLGVG
ncbi:MAG TPA: hypothetical protein VK466_00280 [Terriglobales bacterium]|nr:hypothetical protein [Terriglobales bacterium]